MKTPEELERFLNLTFLGFVGRIKAAIGSHTSGSELIALTEPKSNIVEAFRNIRTNIIFSSADFRRKVLVITSATMQEGKSLVTANLAVTMAQMGKSVLLVDADLRKPRIHTIFGLDRQPGLSEYLIGETSLESAVQDTSVENLRILPCGSIPPNPSELLASEQFNKFIETVSQRFDIVIFDSPPVMSVTDPVILASRANGVILMVKAGVTSKEVIKRAIWHLREVNAHILGAVLNHSEARNENYYKYYSGYYHYYYKYYSEDDKAKKKKSRTKTPAYSISDNRYLDPNRHSGSL